MIRSRPCQLGPSNLALKLIHYPAVGWGGDRYALFGNKDGKHALVALSTWDSADDADEFFAILYDRQAALKGNKMTLDEQTRYAWTGKAGSGYAAIDTNGNVLLVITPDEATTKRVIGGFKGF